MINYPCIIIGSITQRHRAVVLIICSMLVLFVFILPYDASIASGRRMPLTKESVVACAVRMQNAIESVTAQERQKMTGNVSYSKQIVSRIIVKPITDAGYGFEESVLAIAGQVTTGRMPQDPEHAAALGFILVSIANSSNYLVSYELISSQTLAEINKAANYIIQRY